MTKKLDNRGISLVEIIIAVAIASIVSLLIATMLSNGSYWFTRENQKVDLQNDLQIVSNQLNDRFQEAKEIHIVKCDGAIRIYTGEIDPLTNNLVEQNKGTEKYTDSVITYMDNKLYITKGYMENIPEGYMIADNVMEFDVNIATKPETKEEQETLENGEEVTVEKKYYEAPITVEIKMKMGTDNRYKESATVVKIRNNIDVFKVYKPAAFTQKLESVVPTVYDIR